MQTMPTPALDRQDIDQQLKALSSIYQTTDSILAGEKLKVNVVHSDMEVPAWTDGTTISLNLTQVNRTDFEDVVRLHGLNFHELAHVRYTPRKGTALVTWVLDYGYMRAFNVLEDQRIESLMTIRYPSTSPWLTAAIMRWVVGTPDAIPGAYAFVRGRRYLPGLLRGELRRVFLAPELLPEIDEIVDAYRRLAFPNDYDQAKDLIRRFDNVLRSMSAKMPDGTGLPDPHGHHQHGGEVLDKGRPVSVVEQRRVRDKMTQDTSPSQPVEDQDQDDLDDVDAAHDGADTDADTDDTDGQGHGQDMYQDPGLPAPGQSDADAGSSHQEEEEEQADDEDTTHQGGLGTGGSSFDIDRVRDLAEEMLDDLFDSDEVYDEVRRTQRRVRTFGGAKPLPKPPWMSECKDPDPKFATTAHRLRATMQRLRSQADPGWHREESYGRLNPARFAVSGDLDTAFDRWEEGVHDALDIEAVVLVDYSGSMGEVFNNVANSMWAIKRAMDAVDISCTVVAFESQCWTLYGADERATGKIRDPETSGGTNPLPGLEYAARLMSESTRRHKIVIAITDGDWDYRVDEFGMRSDDYIKKMTDSGVLTAVGFIADPDWFREEDLTPERRKELARENSHGATIAQPADGENLVPFVSSIVTNLVRAQLRGVA